MSAVSSVSQRVLVYGGRGALGGAVVDFFRAKNAFVISVDLQRNEAASVNITVDPAAQSMVDQEQGLLKEVESVLGGTKLDAVLCVAGGWAGGNAASKDFVKNTELMLQQSVWSSAIAARMSALHLKPGGLLQLTGAAAATEGTPGMVGYGAAKAAVHQMTKSLAAAGAQSGLPEGVTVLAILPVTLDTPMNRKWMKDADWSQWTPPAFVADLLHQWAISEPVARPQSGSLLKLVTRDGHTQVQPVGGE